MCLILLENGYRNHNSFIYPVGTLSAPSCHSPEWYSKLVARDEMQSRCLEWAQDPLLCFSAYTNIKHMDHWGIFTRLWNLHCSLKKHVKSCSSTVSSDLGEPKHTQPNYFWALQRITNGTDAEIESRMLNSLKHWPGNRTCFNFLSILGNLENTCWCISWESICKKKMFH